MTVDSILTWGEELPLFWWSFAFGLLVIFFFAKDQIDRPVAQSAAKQMTQEEYQRLLRILQPSELRRKTVFARACIVYAVLVSLIYVILCFIAVKFVGEAGESEVAGLQLTSLILSADKIKTAVSNDFASTPLFISLALVGLLPSTPMLKQLEMRIRSVALEITGIPSSLFEMRDAMVRSDISVDSMIEGALPGRPRLLFLDAVAFADQATGPDHRPKEFEQALLKILAFECFIKNDRVWPSPSIVEKYYVLAEETQSASHAFIEDLDAFLDLLRRLAPGVAATNAPAGPIGFSEAPAAFDTLGAGGRSAKTTLDATSMAAITDASILARWEVLFHRANRLTASISLLMVIYAEMSTSLPREDRRSGQVLRKLLADTREKVTEVSPNFDLFLTLNVVLAAALFMLGYFGFREQLVELDYGATATEAGAIYAISATMNYAFVALAILWFRDARINSGGWREARGLVGFPTAQYLTMFIIAVAVSATGLHVSEYLCSLMMSGDSVARYDVTSGRALIGQAPRGLTGGAFAMIVCLILDKEGAKATISKKVIISVASMLVFPLCLVFTGALDRLETAPSSTMYEFAISMVIGLIVGGFLVMSLGHGRQAEGREG